ncbi:MAG TPA: valine--tRNA ligase [Candidatus Acidoferrales bacterium]|nr:valine--tRNA ligase [Candidatus Acidoferrales bacterium]
MRKEIPKAYEPRQIEQRWAREWVKQQLFRADPKAPGPVFSIVIPPPNVTGSLHIGHMLDHTEIDILTRWRRMQGYNTLYLPGTDHASISTQRVVVRQLAEQGIDYRMLGREGFEKKVWEWKERSGGTITSQMVQLGESCDWSRERFTLSPELSRAVREVFVRLYEEGLIYRAHYLVNWCPVCQTVISDLETVHEECVGNLWYIRYPVVGSNEHVVVATTRPETMLGDTAVAVHPEDERYAHQVGKKVRLPLMNREIPIIADRYVDREFGTGVVKVTPAHDPNDFEAGRRHNLPEIDVLTDDGHMSAAAGKYAGLDRFEARKKIVEDLQAEGLLERVVNHTYAIGICDRSKTVIEPRASTQWFVRMKPLAEPALAAVERGEIEIVPENWRAVYFEWMRNIRDWCISRQLWWGHRIPAWHCDDCGEITVAREEPKNCAHCSSAKLEQDPDVLDTWFSSALWPFSTMGWPDDTEDLRVYYPTSVLITGYDILFFWVARMIMMGLKFTGQVPFRQVYLHSLVKTPEGQKMSKSKGTGIDPMALNQQYGTDAMRFTLAVVAAPGTDIILTDDRIRSSRAFANKIWNAARFLFVNLHKIEAVGVTAEELAAPEVRSAAPHRHAGTLELVDRWIFSRASRVSAEVNAALEQFRFHEAAHVVYHFFWGEFCDWYIEWVKPRLDSPDRDVARTAWRNLFAVFHTALRLLHPFMPFLTEELWHRLPRRPGIRSIAFDRFPEPREVWQYEQAEKQMALIQKIIGDAREIRADLKLDPKKKVAAEISSTDSSVRALVEAHREPILRLAMLSELQIGSGHLSPKGGAIRSTAQFDLRIPYGKAIDVRAEVVRLRKEMEKLARDLESKQNRLADEAFRSRAPEEIVRSLELTLRERQVEYKKLVERLAQLESDLGASSAG